MILTALSFGIAAITSLQGSADPNDVTFLQAIQPLASQQTLFLQLQGSTTFHGITTPIVTNLSWNSSVGGTSGTLVTLQVEMETWINNVLTKRIVGDGNTLWTYDLVHHTYAATIYGGSNNNRPVSPPSASSYISTLLSALNLQATGNETYVTKLLRQVFAPNGTSYSSSTPIFSSWMPGVLSQGLLPNGPVPDPVNSQLQYSATAADNFYMYNGSPKRSIVLEILQGSTGANGVLPIVTLQNIYFNQLDTVARFPKLTQWVLTPYPGVTFATSLFLPYTAAQIQNWHSIVGPKSVSD